MPVMDEFKEERNRLLKEGSLKDKLNYFVYYYKWHVVAIILIIWVVVSLIVTIVNHKNPAFYSVVVNGTQLSQSDTYAEDFGKIIAIDEKKEEVVLETDLYLNWEKNDEMTASTSQKIAVYVSAGDLDTIECDAHAMNYYAYNSIIKDVREYLTPEQAEYFEPYYFYIDQALIDAKNQAEADNDYSYKLVYPENPYDPSTMENPVPVAINIKDCTKFSDHYYFKKDILFGIFKNTSRLEDCVKFLDYIREN